MVRKFAYQKARQELLRRPSNMQESHFRREPKNLIPAENNNGR